MHWCNDFWLFSATTGSQHCLAFTLLANDIDYDYSQVFHLPDTRCQLTFILLLHLSKLRLQLIVLRSLMKSVLLFVIELFI